MSDVSPLLDLLREAFDAGFDQGVYDERGYTFGNVPPDFDEWLGDHRDAVANLV